MSNLRDSDFKTLGLLLAIHAHSLQSLSGRISVLTGASTAALFKASLMSAVSDLTSCDRDYSLHLIESCIELFAQLRREIEKDGY